MLKEFRAFIAKGNVLDLAVAVIIGAAFGKIVTSLTEDIIMPIIGSDFRRARLLEPLHAARPRPRRPITGSNDRLCSAQEAAGAPVLGWGEFVTVRSSVSPFSPSSFS